MARRLGHLGDLHGDLRDVLGGPALRLGEGDRLGLVTEEHVDVREHVHHRLLERGHLHEERRGEVEHVALAVLRGVLGHLKHGVGGHGEEEAGGVEEARVLHELPVLGLLEVLNLVVVGRVDRGDEGALAAVDEDAAGAGGGGLVDHVVGVDAVGGAKLLHILGVAILADASHVGGGIGDLEHPLRDADGVLGGAAGDVLHLELLAHVLVHGRVLLLGEDGVVELDAVLVEELLGNHRGDVDDGVAHTEEHAREAAGLEVGRLRGARGETGAESRQAGGDRRSVARRGKSASRTRSDVPVSSAGGDRGNRRARGGTKQTGTHHRECWWVVGEGVSVRKSDETRRRAPRNRHARRFRARRRRSDVSLRIFGNAIRLWDRRRGSSARPPPSFQ